MKCIVNIFCLFILLPTTMSGHENAIRFVNDSIHGDTIIQTIPLKFKPSKDSITTNDPILRYINQRRTKNKFNDWVGGLIIRDQNAVIKTTDIDYEKEYQRLSQKTIAAIHYIRLDPFGTSIYDTTKQATTWIEKTGNSLRFTTSKRIIRKNLTIKEGEYVDPRDLFESERILRQLDFIGKARIEVELNGSDTTQVNVLVITRDRFPHAFSTRGNVSNPELSIYSSNLTGNGVGFSHTTVYENGNRIGNEEKLTVNNIERTRINLEAIYSNRFENQYYFFKGDRNFYISQLKYAGGFLYNRSYKTNYHPVYTQAKWDNFFNYEYTNVWMGRSFKIETQNYFDQSHLYLIGLFAHSDFYNLPDSLMHNTALRNNFYYVGSISFSKRNYFRNTKIYNYDRTEDVPYGFMTSITYGINKAPSVLRPYLGAHFSFGKALIPNKGYLYGKIEAGSFFNGGKREQGQLNFNTKYISSLYNAGRSQYRYFIDVNYIRGFNRLPNENLYLTEDYQGITSFDNMTLQGKERLVLNVEHVFFTPHRLIGFNMMLLSFLDIGIIGDGHSNLFTQNYQASLGGAIRFINNKLVFKTIEVRLAWLPLLPKGAFPFDMHVGSETIKSFNDFVPEPPLKDTFK